MAKTLITLTGTNFRMGTGFLEPGMTVELKKEPDNAYDKEAIMVKYEGMHIGYVANSIKTVLDNTISAGRLYDQIGKKAKAKVVLVLPNAAVLKVSKKSMK